MRWLCLVFLAAPAQADSLVATRLIAPGAIIAAPDVAQANANIPGALARLDDVIGKAARVTIFAGRPLRASDIGAPTLVKRNQPVALRYSTGALAIMAEGRALGSGGAGDTIRVMNTASKTTLTGLILLDGTLEVKGAPCAGC